MSGQEMRHKTAQNNKSQGDQMMFYKNLHTYEIANVETSISNNIIIYNEGLYPLFLTLDLELHLRLEPRLINGNNGDCVVASLQSQ